MNLGTDLNFQADEDTMRIAVVELIDEDNSSECIAMADDHSIFVGRGATAEDAIADLEQKLYDAENDFMVEPVNHKLAS